MAFQVSGTDLGTVWSQEWVRGLQSFCGMDGECRIELQNMTGQNPLACSFIQSTNNLVLGTILGVGDIAVNKTDKNFCLSFGASVLILQSDSKRISKI